jgi:hypothetical protein
MQKILDLVNQARKAGAALSVGVAGWCAQVQQSPSEAVTQSEWIALAGVISAAVAVFATRNRT